MLASHPAQRAVWCQVIIYFVDHIFIVFF